MKTFSVSLFVIATVLYGAEQDEVLLLRWAGPPGSRPGTYEEWIAEHPYTIFSSHLDNAVSGNGRQGSVAILTDSSIAQALASSISQLTSNLQAEGYAVLSYQIAGGTPETLRTFLQNLYNTENIEGALLVGDLPIAWFEIANDFNTYGYADFPIDLFYMDLNGTWLDTMNTGNGKYDGHIGDVNPEIYVGRLITTGLGTDTLLLKNYFKKDNAYRFDTLLLNQRALVFVDDDWIPNASVWAYNVSILYPDTMNYFDAETTRASVYRTKLDTVQAWVSVFVHSWSGGHQFFYNSGSSFDYYYSSEYNSQDPPANFYNFFACSFGRYTNNGYGGGRAIFNPSYGLASISSTKTGSMLEFYYFYVYLAMEKTLGEAYKEWFTFITSNGVTFDELCWHYGMTLLGDPWLKPTGHHLGVKENESNLTMPEQLVITSNPVSNEIGIRFSLNISAATKIILYDGAGRKIENLLAETLGPGQYNILHRVAELPQGVYILKAELGRQVFCRKIVKI